MGCGCGVKSSDNVQVGQPQKLKPPELIEDPKLHTIETEMEGISLKKACIGHYFSGRRYCSQAEFEQIKSKWKQACLSNDEQQNSEPLFQHRNVIMVDEGITENDAEINLLKFAEKNETIFIRMLAAGPPGRYRWVAWKVALRIKSIRKERLYDELKTQKTPWLTDIEKDLDRTFPSHPLFSAETFARKGKLALKRIFIAYAVYNKHVGYCQGMNFIAAFLLIISGFQEEDVFWAIVSLTRYKQMNDPLGINGIEGLYSDRFPLLRALEKLFDQILLETMPALKEHLESIDFPKELWLQKWISTAFLYSFPKTYCVRLWDAILAYGFSHVLSITLSILRDLKGDLLGNEFIGCYELLKSLQNEGENNYLPEVDEVVKNAIKIKLDWSKYSYLFERYKLEVAKEDEIELKKKQEKERKEKEEEIKKQEINPQDTEMKLEEFEHTNIRKNTDSALLCLPEIKSIRKASATVAKEKKSPKNRDSLEKLPPISQPKFVFECNSEIFEENEKLVKNQKPLNCSLEAANKKKPLKYNMKKSTKSIIRIKKIEESPKPKPKPKIENSPIQNTPPIRKPKKVKAKSKIACEEEIKSAELEDEDSLVFSSLQEKTVQFLTQRENTLLCQTPPTKIKARITQKVIFI